MRWSTIVQATAVLGILGALLVSLVTGLFGVWWWFIPLVLALLVLVGCTWWYRWYYLWYDFFTGYDPHTGTYNRLDQVRTLIIIVTFFVSVIGALSVQSWVYRQFDSYNVLPAFASAVAIIALGVYVWHTVNIRDFDDIELKVSPYIPGWILLYTLYLLRWWFVPVWAFYIGAKGFLDRAGRTLVMAATFYLVWLTCFSEEYVAAESWAFLLGKILPWAIGLSLLYIVVPVVRWFGTYVYVDGTGQVYAVDSSFFKNWKGVWRNERRRGIDWDGIDLTDEDYWDLPGMDKFAPVYRISLATEVGFQFSVYCVTPDMRGLISEEAGTRKAHEEARVKVEQRMRERQIEEQLAAQATAQAGGQPTAGSTAPNPGQTPPAAPTT